MEHFRLGDSSGEDDRVDRELLGPEVHVEEVEGEDEGEDEDESRV